MNDADLLTYVVRVLDAYNAMARRMEELECEVKILKTKWERDSDRGCKIYKMEILESIPNKNF
ncbi:hypothetical protein [Bacteroides fluxus]|uniref:hypothetical protein n=1 Tax=Bacteroides fluxus TaxID=626930 RepID=UPI0023A7C048|nr:hypothetical protein [Bacteroides fluxus]